LGKYKYWYQGNHFKVLFLTKVKNFLYLLTPKANPQKGLPKKETLIINIAQNIIPKFPTTIPYISIVATYPIYRAI